MDLKYDIDKMKNDNTNYYLKVFLSKDPDLDNNIEIKFIDYFMVEMSEKSNDDDYITLLNIKINANEIYEKDESELREFRSYVYNIENFKSASYISDSTLKDSILEAIKDYKEYNYIILQPF